MKSKMQLFLPILFAYSLSSAIEDPEKKLIEDKVGQQTESHAARAHRQSKEVLTNSGESPLISDRNFNEQRCKKINGEVKCMDKSSARNITESMKNENSKHRQ